MGLFESRKFQRKFPSLRLIRGESTVICEIQPARTSKMKIRDCHKKMCLSLFHPIYALHGRSSTLPVNNVEGNLRKSSFNSMNSTNDPAGGDNVKVHIFFL